MDCGKEGTAVFGVSGGDSAPAFEMQERIFDQVAQLVEFFVVRSLIDAVFFRRNDGVHAPGGGLLEDRVGIIALVRDEVIGVHALDQAARLCAIRSGTFRNKHSDRHTKRIHGQMYFCVEPPFVRLIS